ncbi:hypothetical protein N7481_011674 [Penicillium waksmanii]|uniref:uncharacterized protein n=1 Tax=Penicillium waksmanii TaxID=69791 RepID=UPI002547860B|nr:uncharacterized protein N7481_011674 [Penicillium waksmanii]KAJ5974464.1 hypothetical protein N7481_011674 [Penicillium waksmanii]
MAISLANNNNCSPTRLGLVPEEKVSKKQSMWHKLGLRRWLGRDDRDSSDNDSSSPHNNHNNNNNHNRAASVDSNSRSRQDNLTRRLSRRVGVGLPRSTPFKRSIPELPDRLAPEHEQRRAQSADRSSPSNARSQSPLPPTGPRLSAPEVQWLGPTHTTMVDEPLDDFDPFASPEPLEPLELVESEEPNEETSLYAGWEGDLTTDPPEVEAPAPDTIDMDLDNRWILNLSMHFRDRSEREKFFITYVENPYQWRRVTISCDYRGAEPDSLEADLKGLRYQRDKSVRIYESLRDSLPDIQFYDTVTNLKVETSDGRLHVHVTEDVNEIIPYPPISSIGHLAGARCIPETHLHFDAHLSGFVYKVQQDGHNFIKKEIPGPDTVDEFLYEINALHALVGSPNVIQVGGIVVDEHHQKVKGLLISYAERGALVDILYDQRGRIPFARRERWAKEIVQGLCEIHESGYVQGDFTLSNIVVDADDKAFIIDINRRGCPVGWEPPEIAQKIESNQRISMYIGVKTDLYQLGMTLWALAMQEDEPERQPRPLFLGFDVDVPDYYRRIVDICLSPMPRHRISAKELLSFFPTHLFPRPDHRFPCATSATTHLPKSNLVDPQRTRTTPNLNLFTPVSSLKYSSEQDIDISPPLFHDHPGQGKRSTVTLADSNDGVAFPSRHSSASTLNHHESNGLDGGCWNEDSHSSFREPASELPTDHQIQTDVPSVWESTVGHGFGPMETDLQPRLCESHTESEESTESSYHSSNATTASEQLSNGLGLAHDEESQSAPTDRNNAPLVRTNEFPEPSTSLFLSALPINPALSKRKSFPPDVSSIRRGEDSSAQSNPSHHQLAFLLADSQLPINPAVAPPVPLLVSSKSETPESSILPLKQSVIAPHGLNISLSESRLPINPAIGIPKRKSFPPASLSDRKSGIHLVQLKMVSERLVSFLSESRLPINPALNTSEPHTILPASENKPRPGLRPARSPIQCRPTPSLSESILPINPALSIPEHNTIPSVSEKKPSPGLRPARPSIQRRLSSSLSESQLPINPAFRNIHVNLF